MNIPYQTAAFAERNRHIAYEAVIRALEQAASKTGITRKDIAKAIGRSPSQISTTLNSPSNWTLDTVSHLLRAVGATMDYRVVFDAEQTKSNIFHPRGVPSPPSPDTIPLKLRSDNVANTVTAMTIHVPVKIAS